MRKYLIIGVGRSTNLLKIVNFWKKYMNNLLIKALNGDKSPTCAKSFPKKENFLAYNKSNLWMISIRKAYTFLIFTKIFITTRERSIIHEEY